MMSIAFCGIVMLSRPRTRSIVVSSIVWVSAGGAFGRAVRTFFEAGAGGAFGIGNFVLKVFIVSSSE
jgi:hypothetical protein